MALGDVVTCVVALALPVWLLVEQGLLWIAASGGERQSRSPSRARSRRPRETFTADGSGALPI